MLQCRAETMVAVTVLDIVAIWGTLVATVSADSTLSVWSTDKYERGCYKVTYDVPRDGRAIHRDKLLGCGDAHV
jgi:hypothetical protein